MGGAYVRIRSPFHVVRWGRRVVPWVLAFALVAAASWVASPAAATGSRHDHVRPKNRLRPRIVGTPRVGVALKATRGTWTLPRPVVYEYRWFRCPAGGGKCRRIVGVARRRYTPSSRDIGMTLRVSVTARNAAGSGRATSRRSRVVPASADTGGVQPTLPTVASSPTVSGTAQAGQALTASPGIWNGTPPIAYAYQWERCDPSGLDCGQIADAASSAYAVSGVDVGTTIRAVVTATNSAGSVSARSAVTPTVRAANTPPANTSPPTITGAARQGQTLTANPGTWSGTQPINYTFQWQDCDSNGAHCTAISGATAPTYRPTSTDVGRTLRLTVTARNMEGAATASSGPTAVVLSASAVALWHMDETTGSTMFDSVGTHNGTLHSVQLGLPGFSGTAYGFNGSSSYVSVPSADVLNPHSANITITIHIKTTATPPPSPDDWDVIRKGYYTSSGGEYNVELQHSGQASCTFKGSLNYIEQFTAGPALNDGNWHTIQCIKTATAVELVVDGQVHSTPIAIGTIANTDPIDIGARPGSDWTQGTLDEASINIG
jgi:Concanavalin A-like lectin/glucanases superfamily/Ig domain of plant-specific actin-binding protein